MSSLWHAHPVDTSRCAEPDEAGGAPPLCPVLGAVSRGHLPARTRRAPHPSALTHVCGQGWRVGITAVPAGAVRVGMHVERTRDGLAARVVQRDVSEVAWPHMEGERPLR